MGPMHVASTVGVVGTLQPPHLPHLSRPQGGTDHADGLDYQSTSSWAGSNRDAGVQQGDGRASKQPLAAATLHPFGTDGWAAHPPSGPPHLRRSPQQEKHKNIRAHIPITTVTSRGALEPLDELGPFDDLRNLDLCSQLGSPVYRQVAALFVLSSFWANFYPGVAVQEIGDVYGKMGSRGIPLDDRIAYGGYLSLAMVAGMVCIPLSALAMGHHSYGFSVLAGALGLTMLLWAFLLLYQTPGTLLASFVCYSAFRSILYSFTYSYLQEVFGRDHFGVLVGVLNLLAGSVGLLQLPLASAASGNCHLAASVVDFEVCSTGSWAAVNFAAALSSGYCFFFTYHDWAVRYRLEQRKSRIAREIGTFRKHGTQLAPLGGAKTNASKAAPLARLPVPSAVTPPRKAPLQRVLTPLGAMRNIEASQPVQRALAEGSGSSTVLNLLDM